MGNKLIDSGRVDNKMLMAFFVSATGFFVLYGRMLASKFGIIDDHEFFYYMGTNDRTKIKDILPTLFEKTEIGSWGSHARFRPSYHFVRVFETAIFGNNPFFFYLLQLILFLIFLYTALRLINTTLPMRSNLPVHYLLLTSMGLLLVAAPALQDILTRLGTAEIYLLAVLPSILILTIKGILERINNQSFFLLHFLIILAVGFKENAVILVLLSPLVFWRQARFNNTNPFKITLHVFTLLWSFFCFLGPAIAIHKNGGLDYYGEKRTLGGSVQNLFTMTSDKALILSVITIGALAFLSKYKRCEKKVISSEALILFAMLICIRSFESIVYGSSIGYEFNRYSILKQITNLMMIFIVIGTLINSLLLFRVFNVHLRQIFVFSLFLVFALTNSKVIGSVPTITPKVDKSIEFTNEFHTTLTKLIAAHKGEKSIILFLSNPYHIEPMYSLQRYFQVLLSENRTYLETRFITNEDAFENTLISEMELTALIGNEELDIAPLRNLIPSENQICVMFDERVSDVRCKVKYLIQTSIY